MGVRYDIQWLADPIQTDFDNMAPRVGAAYSPGDRQTVLRASYGMFYDRIPLRAVSNGLQRDGTKYKGNWLAGQFSSATTEGVRRWSIDARTTCGFTSRCEAVRMTLARIC